MKYDALATSVVDVLIVDDNAPLCTILAEFLESEGYRVTIAYDGRQAMRVMEQNTVRILLTDIFMPEIDGIELIMHLRKATPAPAILAMSGYNSENARPFLESARLLGAQHVFMKPFPLTDLLTYIQHLIAGTKTGD